MSANNLEDVRPRIGNVEPVTMRCEYQLPFERQSSQTACGNTIQNQNGDMNWRVVIEGILTIEQLDAIGELRGQDSVEVITAEFGRINVSFDQFNVTRASEEAVGDIEGEYGPLLSFQLQSKEEDDQDPVVSFVQDESIRDT